ncbi:hypothetical protein EBR96_06665 [bacterium]|nr:hypothetical protein [bacterium]
MKDSHIEIVFIGIIILIFALWKISNLIKTRCYERRREGFVAEAAAAAAAAANGPVTVPKPRSDAELFLSQIEHLLPANIKSAVFRNDGPILSTENFTTETTENEMTIHQRKKIAAPAPVPAPVPAPEPVPAPVAPSGKEGLENPDANTKEFIDKNITSINPQDSQKSQVQMDNRSNI